MMKRLVIVLAISLVAGISHAQDYFDVVLLSQNSNLGTARSVSMGNAFGALGGDFSSASINPAGIGVYRSDEFTFTPSYTFANSNVEYLGTNTERNANLFNFSNVGYVMASQESNANRLFTNFSFGVGYNRLKDFKSKQRIIGNDAQSTLLDYYTDWANSFNSVDNFDPHNEGLAYNTFLINDDPNLAVTKGIFRNYLATYNIKDVNGDGSEIEYSQKAVLPHLQSKLISTAGSINEFVLSFAGNFQHKTYIGATLGIQSVDYIQNTVFSESDNNDLSAYLSHYVQEENISISGEGVNLKVGIIHRFNRNFRIGAAFHSPTWYGLTYTSDKYIDSYFDKKVGDSNLGYKTSWNDDSYNVYDYKMKSPLKAMISVAYQYANRISISADFEHVDYGKAKFSDYSYDQFDYTNKNSDNQQYLNATNNIRGGVEVRVTPAISLRGGYEYIGNAWQDVSLNSNDALNVASCGLGYRNTDYFIDFSLSRIFSKEQVAVHETPVNYSAAGTSPIASITQNRVRASITFGLKF